MDMCVDMCVHVHVCVSVCMWAFMPTSPCERGLWEKRGETQAQGGMDAGRVSGFEKQETQEGK